MPENQEAFAEYLADFHGRQSSNRDRDAAENSTAILNAAKVGGVFLLAAGVIYLFSFLASGDRKPDAPDHSAPITYAQGFVKDFLKSPATASFPWDFREYTVTNLGAGQWRVAGYVDSQNGFGATVRTYWTVEMQDAGATWKLADASIN
jgi:hypothetical protein